jgi:hypothetical protein
MIRLSFVKPHRSILGFAPEGSLFKLERHPRKLSPCSKDQAIQTLTSGYISVTESTRFVICEAKQDRLFYTSIAKTLVERGALDSTPNIVFVQASDVKDRDGGGCDQVRSWSAKLPEVGLTQVLGLIDRDIDNRSSKTIKVLKRYSFENYLFDPVIVFAVLMDRGESAMVFDSTIKNRNYHRLAELTDTELQPLADAVCRAVEKQFSQLQMFTDTFDVEYLCGKRLVLPTWLRDYRGHDLVRAFRDTFRNVVGNNCVLTERECSEMLSERVPEFIPLDLVATIRELQLV